MFASSPIWLNSSLFLRFVFSSLVWFPPSLSSSSRPCLVVSFSLLLFTLSPPSKLAALICSCFVYFLSQNAPPLFRVFFKCFFFRVGATHVVLLPHPSRRRRLHCLQISGGHRRFSVSFPLVGRGRQLRGVGHRRGRPFGLDFRRNSTRLISFEILKFLSIVQLSSSLSSS